MGFMDKGNFVPRLALTSLVVIFVILVLEIVILIVVSKLDGSSSRPDGLMPPTTKKSQITVNREDFGTLNDGKQVDRYTISNRNGVSVQIITYGSIITSIKAPDRRGHVTELTLGFDDIKGYELHNSPYFGALVGRVANRIARGQFVLDNVTYQLNINNGPNHLHGGPKGWSKLLWKARALEDGVEMTLVSADGDENYPGEVTTNVTYRLTENNELIVRFQATTKKKATPINLTTHPYFNLAGEENGTINDHIVEIFADYYLKSTKELIPTGTILRVEGTPMDLRQPQRLGRLLPLFNGSGYDHTFCVRGTTGKKMTARVYHPGSGRRLEVYTDQPGVQFYTGNHLDLGIIGRQGHSYPKHSGLCLETQNYPDAVNHVNFPDSILREGSTYDHWAWYRFSVQSE